MREVTCGFELGDPAAEGWSRSDSTVQRVGSSLHLDGSGNGGSWALQQNDTTEDEAISHLFRTGAHREGWIRAHGLFANASADLYITGYRASSAQFTVHIDGADGLIRIRRGGPAGTVLATSAGALSAATYYQIEISYFVGNSGGYVKVYIDDPGTYVTPAVQVTGADTQADAVATDINCIGLRLSQAASRFDDIAVNSQTLSYDGGSSGVPTVGQTVTQATPGPVTAVIHQVIGDAVSGRLVVHTISGGSFVNNAAITTPALLNALVNAPDGRYVGGLEPSSGAPGPGFQVALHPTANGNSSQLNGTDGNQVDNYALVDDDPLTASSDGVYTGTSGRKDTYGLGNLPASAASVVHAEVVASALKDGSTINTLNGVVRTGGTDYDSEDDFNAALTGSAATYRFPFPSNPNTGVAWAVSEINAMEAGGKLSA